MTEQELVKVSCASKPGVVLTTPRLRALGRSVTFASAIPAEGEASQDLAADVFQAAYQGAPTIKADDAVSPSRQVNSALMRWALDNKDFQSMRHGTQGNLISSITSAGVFWQYMTTDEALAEAMEKQKEAEEAEKQQEEAMQEMRKAAAEGNAQGVAQAQAKADAAAQSAQAAAQAAVEKVEKVQNSAMGSGLVAAAAQKAGEAGDEANALARGYGLESGSSTVEDAEYIQNVMRGNEDKMEEIAKLAGRLKGITASTLANERAANFGVAAHAKMSKRIERLFPTERISLSHNAPKALRAKKVAQLCSGGLLGWEPSTEEKSEGSLVLIVDGSGSMDGQPEVIAKATALGIAKAMLEDGQSPRKYRITTFSDRGSPLYKVSSEQDFKAHIEWAGLMQNGGTVFDYALEIAMEDVRAMQRANTKGVDVGIITDGYSSVSDACRKKWEALVKETGARLFYIGIGGGAHTNDALMDMCSMSALFENVDELNPDSLTVSITKNILNGMH